MLYFSLIGVSLQFGPEILRPMAENFYEVNMAKRRHLVALNSAVKMPVSAYYKQVNKRQFAQVQLPANQAPLEESVSESDGAKYFDNFLIVIKGGDASNLPNNFEMIFNRRLIDAIRNIMPECNMIFDSEEYICKDYMENSNCFLGIGRKLHAGYVLYVNLKYKENKVTNELEMRFYDIEKGKLRRKIKEPFENLAALGMVNFTNLIYYLKDGIKPYKVMVGIKTPGVEGVNVYFDGWLVGQTPFSHLISLETGRSHKLVLKKLGYKPVKKIIRVGLRDNKVNISAIMEKIPVTRQTNPTSFEPIFERSPVVKPAKPAIWHSESPNGSGEVIIRRRPKEIIISQPGLSDKKGDAMRSHCDRFESEFMRKLCRKRKINKPERDNGENTVPGSMDDCDRFKSEYMRRLCRGGK